MLFDEERGSCSASHAPGLPLAVVFGVRGMRRSVVASGDERNEGRGTWDLLMANEEHGSGAINRCGVLPVPGRTWNEEVRGTREGPGTRKNEESGTRNAADAREGRFELPRPS